MPDHAGIININLPWVNCIIPDDANDIEGLLNLRRKSLRYQGSDIIIDILSACTEIDAQLLDR